MRKRYVEARSARISHLETPGSKTNDTSRFLGWRSRLTESTPTSLREILRVLGGARLKTWWVARVCHYMHTRTNTWGQEGEKKPLGTGTQRKWRATLLPSRCPTVRVPYWRLFCRKCGATTLPVRCAICLSSLCSSKVLCAELPPLPDVTVVVQVDSAAQGRAYCLLQHQNTSRYPIYKNLCGASCGMRRGPLCLYLHRASLL